MAAVVGIAASAAGITGGVADRDYSTAQQILTEGGQDEQMLVLAMLAYDQGNIDTANFLLTQVSSADPGKVYTKDDIIDYYRQAVPSMYGGANNIFAHGDSYREISDALIVLSATLSAGIVAYAEITRPKDSPGNSRTWHPALLRLVMPLLSRPILGQKGLSRG
jgi:hypothetical protein